MGRRRVWKEGEDTGGGWESENKDHMYTRSPLMVVIFVTPADMKTIQTFRLPTEAFISSPLIQYMQAAN